MSWILCCLIICFHETTLYLGLSMVLYFIEFYKRCFSLRSYRSSTWRPIQSISLVLYDSLGISSLCSSLHCLFWNQSRYIRVDLPARLSSLNTNSRITKNKSFPLFNGSVHWALLSSFRKTVCSFSLFMLQIEQIRCWWGVLLFVISIRLLQRAFFWRGNAIYFIICLLTVLNIFYCWMSSLMTLTYLSGLLSWLSHAGGLLGVYYILLNLLNWIIALGRTYAQIMLESKGSNSDFLKVLPNWVFYAWIVLWRFYSTSFTATSCRWWAYFFIIWIHICNLNLR